MYGHKLNTYEDYELSQGMLETFELLQYKTVEKVIIIARKL